MESFLQLLSGGWLQIIAALLAAYLIGSISFSIIITSRVANKDIRTMGSGNAGFTNVLRSIGWGPAIATILLDFAKGLLAVAIGGMLFRTFTVNGIPSAELVSYGKYIAGFACILGHMYPIYYGFKGGKGVVTSLALMAIADWRVFLVCLATFFLVFAFTRTVSVGSISFAALYGVYTFIFAYFVDYLPNINSEEPHTMGYVVMATVLSFAIGAVIIIKHKSNIKRLLNGTEMKTKTQK